MRNSVCMLLVLHISLWSFGQKIELAIQKGHSARITGITFNKDGRLLASIGEDHLINLWHVPSGRQMATTLIENEKPVRAVSFSDNDDFLFVRYQDGTNAQWDINSSTWLNAVPVARSGKQIDTQSYNSDDSLYQFNIHKFYLNKINRSTHHVLYSRVPVDISQNFTSLAVSENHGLVIGGCEDGKVYVYGYESGKNKATLNEHYSSVNAVSFTHSQDFFATASDDRSIIIWDTKTLKPVRRLFGRSFRFESLTFDHSGTVLAVGDELGKGRIIDLKSSRLNVSTYQWHDQKTSDVRFSADDRLVYSGGFDNRVNVFDARQGKSLKSYTYRDYLSLGDWVLKSFGIYRDPYAWVNTVSVSPSGHYLVAGGAWRESEIRRQPQKIWFKDLISGQLKSVSAHQGTISSLAFATDLSFVSAGGNQVCQWYYNNADGKFYFRESKLPIEASVHSVVMLSKDTAIINTGKTLFWYDLQNETIIKSLIPEKNITAFDYNVRSRILAYSEFNDLTIESPNIKTTIKKAHTDKITAVAISASHPIVATASWDATVKLWNTGTGDLIATIVAIGKDDHIVITPDNFYFGTRNSLKGIGFKYGKQFVSPEQYDLRFNRPDIVLSRIALAPPIVVNSFRRAYLKRLQRMNFTEQMLNEEIHQPQIQIVSSDIPLNTAEEKLSFNIRAFDSKYNIDRVNIYVNNVPSFGLQGIDLRKLQKAEVQLPVTIDLSSGKNKIQVSCLNEKGVESILETFSVECTHKGQKPDLYLTVISVSNYQNKAMNLKYAAKDGKDIAMLFSRRTNDFAHVYIDTLFNASAVKERITDLKKKFMQTRVEDEVIVYVSGHGMLDDKLDFYFGTHDIDFSNPAGRGLKYEELESLLDGIPARQKLLLMDACHSGEVDKSVLIASAEQTVALSKNKKGSIKTYTYPVETTEENYKVGITTSFDLMQELFANVSKGSGAVVISAAAGNSYALESDEWKNGVFTYALINGLRNREADTNNDKIVTVKELKEYVSREVERLTQGQQKPTSRQENVEFDFKVW